MKDYFHQVYLFWIVWNLGCLSCKLVGQTTKIRTMARTLGQSYQDFGNSSWGTLNLTFISLIACIKIQKQIWLISIIIANKTYKLIDLHECVSSNWWANHDDKNGNLMNMQESLASCVSDSAILVVKLTLCCSVEGLMYLEMQYACHTCVVV